MFCPWYSQQPSVEAHLFPPLYLWVNFAIITLFLCTWYYDAVTNSGRVKPLKWYNLENTPIYGSICEKNSLLHSFISNSYSTVLSIKKKTHGSNTEIKHGDRNCNISCKDNVIFFFNLINIERFYLAGNSRSNGWLGIKGKYSSWWRVTCRWPLCCR